MARPRFEFFLGTVQELNKHIVDLWDDVYDKAEKPKLKGFQPTKLGFYLWWE